MTSLAVQLIRVSVSTSGSWVRCLVGELRSWMQHGTAKRKVYVSDCRTQGLLIIVISFPYELVQMHLRSILIVWQLYTIMHYLLCYLIFQSQHTLVILLNTLDIVSSQLNERFLSKTAVSLCSQMHFSVQFSSVTQSCSTLCDPMNCSTPGFPVQNQLPELTQTHVLNIQD